MISEKDSLKHLQNQTGTAFVYLTLPHDKLKNLAQTAILVKTTDDKKIGHFIPFTFAIVLGPQYLGEHLSAERDMLVNSYLRILTNSAVSSMRHVTASDFQDESSNKLTNFILVTQRDL